MLTYVLAFVVGLASLGLYATTFALPEVSRKNDLIWSGVGLFYALVLWVCAGRITGGVLLGQLASTALIGWFGWQTMEGRWNETPENERVNAGKVAGVRSKISGLATKVQDLSASVTIPGSEGKQDSPIEPIAEEPPLKLEDFGNPPKVEIPEAVKPTLKSFNNPDAGKMFGGLLNNAKSMLGDFNKPKNKELYVRKNFKDDATAAVTEAVTEAAATVGSAIESVVENSMDDDFDFGDVTEKVEDVVETVSEVTPEVEKTVEAVAEAIETKSDEILDEFGDRINP
jgi:Ycf66 protein N-terminus